MKKLNKIVLTGAAGNLGNRLRGPMAALCNELVSTDISQTEETLLANETFVVADLADLDAIQSLTKGADMIVHFGSVAVEDAWENILGPNIIGAYNIWESAHRNGVRRVVFASSIHSVGMHHVSLTIDERTSHRPDGYYGLAKCFTEDLARMYWDRRGIEAVCMRIMSCTEKPNNPRAVGSWLSYPDLIQMVEKSVTAQVVEFTVLYGVSNNDRAPAVNRYSAHIGYKPVDNGEDYAAEVFAAAPTPDPSDLAQARHGGPFAYHEMGTRDAINVMFKKK